MIIILIANICLFVIWANYHAFYVFFCFFRWWFTLQLPSLVFVSLFSWYCCRAMCLIEFAFYFNLCPLHRGKGHYFLPGHSIFLLKKICSRFTFTFLDVEIFLVLGCRLTSFLSFPYSITIRESYSSAMLWMKFIVSDRLWQLKDKGREVLSLVHRARQLEAEFTKDQINIERFQKGQSA